MVRIKIDTEGERLGDLQVKLRDICRQINRGFTSGEGWDITQDEEGETSA